MKTVTRREDMLEELVDRFGEPPKSVQNLLAVAELKALAHRAYVTEIKQTGGGNQNHAVREGPAECSGNTGAAGKIRPPAEIQAGDESVFSVSARSSAEKAGNGSGSASGVRGEPGRLCGRNDGTRRPVRERTGRSAGGAGSS